MISRIFVTSVLLIAPFSGQSLGRVGLSFAGSSLGTDSFAIPADGATAVGTDQIVEFVNGRFTVYRKTDGTVLQTMNDSNFWHLASLKFPRNWDVTDPRIVYDTASQRWFAAEIDYDPRELVNTNRFLLAVSASGDATGKWNGFEIPNSTTGNYFADFPTLGLDSDGVYLGGDLFDASGNGIGPTLISLPKTALLGTTPTIANRTLFGVLNYDQRGYIIQPAICMDGSARGTVIATTDLGYDFFTGEFVTNTSLAKFSVENAGGPGKATLTGTTFVDVPGYTAPVNPPQPDGSTNLDDGDARFSSTVYCIAGVLYAAHGTQVDGRAAIRWYRINAETGTLLESGTIQHPNLDFFYPAIAANSNGKLVIGFNGCSSNVFISCYAIAGETVGNSTQFGDLLLLKPGEASYQKISPDGTSRWGDYTAACADPVDTNHFWVLQQCASNGNSWSTQISEIIVEDVRPSDLLLNIAAGGEGLILSWPELAVPARLQQNDALVIVDSWRFVAETPTTNAGVVSVSLPFSSEQQFYRLVQP